MFFADELQKSGVHVSLRVQGLVEPPKHHIRSRKITLRDENVVLYGDDAALELALQASLEDAARATPRRKPAPPSAPPGPQLHPFG